MAGSRLKPAFPFRAMAIAEGDRWNLQQAPEFMGLESSQAKGFNAIIVIVIDF
jgi:hypothetical protein